MQFELKLPGIPVSIVSVPVPVKNMEEPFFLETWAGAFRITIGKIRMRAEDGYGFETTVEVKSWTGKIEYRHEYPPRDVVLYHANEASINNNYPGILCPFTSVPASMAMVTPK